MEPERPNIGRKSQVGGGLATLIGVLMLVSTPSVPRGAAIDIHQMATVFIVIGIFLFAFGTLAQWYFLD